MITIQLVDDDSNFHCSSSPNEEIYGEKKRNEVKVITERRTKASIIPILVARNTFRVFVKTSNVFNISISNIIISSNAFCQDLTADTEQIYFF